MIERATTGLIIFLAALGGCTTNSSIPDEGPDARSTVTVADSPLIPVGESPLKGADHAWVTVVVFADFQSPFSARLATTLDQVLDGVDDEIVRRVYKYHPRDDSPAAIKAARAAEAAHRQGKFWEFHDRLFDAYARLSGDEIDQVLAEIADEADLDRDRWKRDMESQEVIETVEEDRALARKLDLAEGPAVFVSGGYIGGVRSHTTYMEAITNLYAVLRRAVEQGDMERSQVYRESVEALYEHTRQTAGPDRQAPLTISELPIGGDAPSTGPIDDALVNIGVFLNLGAEPNRRMMELLLDHVEDSNGHVRLTFFHLPDTDDEAAHLAHRALEGADSYAQVGQLLRWLIDDENQWRENAELLGDYLEEIGVVPADERDFEQAWRADLNVAEDHGVFATPTIFINGIPLAGLRSPEEVARIIDEQLRQARQLQDEEGLDGWDLYEQVVGENRGE